MLVSTLGGGGSSQKSQVHVFPPTPSIDTHQTSPGQMPVWTAPDDRKEIGVSGPDNARHIRSNVPEAFSRAFSEVATIRTERRERYFKRYTTVVSVSAGSGVGSPYISHLCPADSLRFAAIHFLIASCASFMRLYGPRWTATAASPPCVSVAYTSPAVSNVRVTSKPKSHSIGAPGCVGWW